MTDCSSKAFLQLDVRADPTAVENVPGEGRAERPEAAEVDEVTCAAGLRPRAPERVNCGYRSAVATADARGRGIRSGLGSWMSGALTQRVRGDAKGPPAAPWARWRQGKFRHSSPGARPKQRLMLKMACRAEVSSTESVPRSGLGLRRWRHPSRSRGHLRGVAGSGRHCAAAERGSASRSGGVAGRCAVRCSCVPLRRPGHERAFVAPLQRPQIGVGRFDAAADATDEVQFPGRIEAGLVLVFVVASVCPARPGRRRLRLAELLTSTVGPSPAAAKPAAGAGLPDAGRCELQIEVRGDGPLHEDGELLSAKTVHQRARSTSVPVAVDASLLGRPGPGQGNRGRVPGSPARQCNPPRGPEPAGNRWRRSARFSASCLHDTLSSQCPGAATAASAARVPVIRSAAPRWGRVAPSRPGRSRK